MQLLLKESLVSPFEFDFGQLKIPAGPEWKAWWRGVHNPDQHHPARGAAKYHHESVWQVYVGISLLYNSCRVVICPPFSSKLSQSVFIFSSSLTCTVNISLTDVSGVSFGSSRFHACRQNLDIVSLDWNNEGSVMNWYTQSSDLMTTASPWMETYLSCLAINWFEELRVLVQIKCASLMDHPNIAKLVNVVPHGDRLGLAVRICSSIWAVEP